MSWRSGGVLFAEIWPAVKKHVPDRNQRIDFTVELLRLFMSRDMDPWSVEDVDSDIRTAMRRAGIQINEPERFGEDDE